MSEPIVLPSDRRFKNLTGQVFGKFTVLSFAGNRRWLCRCECGREVKVAGYHLTGEKSKACTKCAKVTHGKSKTVEHKTWLAMRERCNNPKCRYFKHYGGRGIKVCERWDSFELFLQDVGPRPSPKHSLDRYPDNDGNYEPGNVRWATESEQKRNQRSRTQYVFNGRSQLLSEWAEELGIPRATLSNRLYEGWTIERAFTTPVKK